MMKLGVFRAIFLTVLLFGVPVQAAERAGPLVDATWAVARIGQADIRFLDIRARGAQDFAAGHIPGAVFSYYFSAGWRVTGEDGTPGMLPPVAALEQLVGGLGISNASHVVIVARGLSAVEMASAARIYWTFKVLGHDAVSILDGGMTAYRALGDAPLQSGPASVEPTRFTAAFRRALIASKQDVQQTQNNGGVLLDLRPKNQFSGTGGPRFISRKGTIEGAQNLPLGRLTENGAFKTPAALAEIFSDARVAAESPVTCFCNTGHMAALGWFVAHELLGNRQARLYDGSMAEWSQDAALDVVSGR